MKPKQLNDSSVGKRFIRRDYSIVRITKNTGDHFCDEFGRWYFRNGTVVKDAESQYDLMSEIEELPDFQRIDWERLRDCFEKASNGYVSSHLHVAVKEYNSTLPTALVPLPKEMPALWHNALTDLLHNRMQPSEFYLLIRKTYGTPANNLQPLPKEMPKWFHNGISYHNLWSMVCLNYGTPEPKQPLPTVEELAKEIESHGTKIFSFSVESIAKNLHDKYSLPTREWWQDCEKFMYKGRAYKKYSHEVFPDGRTVLHSELAGHNLIYCTPYTPPSAQDIIAKHNLSEEEVKILREGK